MVDLSYCSYLRVSTDNQGITGLGMEAQREAVSRYVMHRGQIIAEFIEVEDTASRVRRRNVTSCALGGKLQLPCPLFGSPKKCLRGDP